MNDGSEVIEGGASGTASKGLSGLLDSFSRGVSTITDVVVADFVNRRIPDQADLRDAAPALDPSQPQSFLQNIQLSNTQLGLLAIAGLLTFGLVTGRFR